jgi:hypothetical protein
MAQKVPFSAPCFGFSFESLIIMVVPSLSWHFIVFLLFRLESERNAHNGFVSRIRTGL